MKKSQWLILLVIAILILGFFALGLDHYFTLEFIQHHQQELNESIQANFLQASVIFFITYVLITAFSLPGAAVLTLLAGALFGLGYGLLLASFASTIGASLAFIIARFLFRDLIETRWGSSLQSFNQGIRKDGAFYLFTLRLIPLFPFFVINIVMALTALRLRTFYWVSQLGMLAGTFVYVNAGTQLASIQSTSDLFSAPLIGSLVLLGIFPYLARFAIRHIQMKKRYGRFSKPTQFDNNLLVIGAGAGGLVSSYIAAAVNARVTLVEKEKMGGDCLNYGCVPSKALIRSARVVEEIRQAASYGVHSTEPGIDFAAVMERVQQVIAKIAPHDSVERYQSLGVECLQGEAVIRTPWEVEVNGKRITSRNIIIATGAKPLVPPIPGLDEVDYLTSDTIWELRTPPNHLLVLGGGPSAASLPKALPASE